MLGAGLLSKSGAVHYEHMLLAAKFFHENLIAFRNVDFWEGIKCAAWSHATDTRVRIARLHGDVPAAAQFFPHSRQMVLRSFESRLDRILLRVVCAQACPQQAMDSFHVRLDRCGVAAHDAPPDPPARRKIVL